jgi:ribosome biogenesis GTPase A
MYSNDNQQNNHNALAEHANGGTPIRIQWFPGHMTRSLRQMGAALSGIDFVVYVVDSRAPSSCLNPVFDDLFGKLPIVYVINKVDLSDATACKLWAERHKGDGRAVISTNSLGGAQTKLLASTARQLCSTKINKFLAKGITISLRGMVVGVPNVGKSTFINNISKSSRAKTGNTPGVTRGKNWYKIDEYLDIMDTPGTLYPKLNDQNIALNLAFIGSIRDQVIDTTELCLALIEKLSVVAPQVLQERFGLDPSVKGLPALEHIAARRGRLLKGGQVDIDSAATALIDDFRKGRLGKVFLD